MEKERFTIAPIQEGEKEKSGQRRNKMPVDFPQQFPLVDRILAPF